MGYYFVHGHCFFGMQVFWWHIKLQMVAKHLRQFWMLSSVACKFNLWNYMCSWSTFNSLKCELCVYSALGQAAPNISYFAKGRAAVSNISSMITDVPSALNTGDKGIVLQKVSGNIDFCKVSFSYPSRKSMVLEELNLSILAGRTHAVVGQSGSGKSTIISLIERFYEPTSGRLIDR